MAKGLSIGSSARGPSTEALLGQGRVPKGRESVPLQGLRSGSRPGLARHPRLQVVLRQGRVTKGTSIGTLAQPPCPQMPQSHPGVAKGRESVALQGLRSGSRLGLARHPRLQVVLRQGRVAKGLSIGSSARSPHPQPSQWHPAHQKGHFVHQESQFVHQDGHFVSIFMQKAAYSGMASDLTYS